MAFPDVPLPDLRLLQLFDVLYGTRSVTRAAEVLGQSQPTVSLGLGRLRRQLGDPLFVRTPTGMQPTPHADALIGPTREVLESLRRLATRAPDFEPATAQRRFRICMTDASHITLLPRLLAQVRARAPQVVLEAMRIDEHTALALESGTADLALGLLPGLEAGFYQQALYPQDWVCLLNDRHGRAGEPFGRAAYEAAAHIGIVAGTGQGLIAEALQTVGLQRRVNLELPGFLGLGAIVSTTDLVATLPRQIGETLALTHGLRVVDCPLPIAGFLVKQHWHARYHHDRANAWLRGVVAELFMA